MAIPFIHIELHTDGLDKAKAFYGELLNWQLEDVPMGEGTYTMIGVGEGTGGGMMTNPAPNVPSHWLACISVEDVAATTQKAEKLGATVIQPKTEVPQAGWFSVITDPAGAAVRLWEPNQAA